MTNLKQLDCLNIVENESMRRSTKLDHDQFDSNVATQVAWNNYVLVTTRTNDNESVGEEP